MDISFEDIIRNTINGNWTDAVLTVRSFGWVRFTNELEDDETMPDSEKLYRLSRLVRINDSVDQ